MADTEQLKIDLWKKLADSPFVMVQLTQGGGHSEPLTVQLDKHQADTLWFFIGRHNRVAAGGEAHVHFASKGHDFFASIAGKAQVVDDASMVDRLWSNQAEAWFPAGKNDPNLALLRFDIAEAELWESDVTLAGRAKMLLGSPIKPDEAGSHAKVESTMI